MTEIIAVANIKGGVLKTTTALNLGAILAESDRSVLLVDLDPQGSLTAGAGVVDAMDPGRTVYGVLSNPAIGATAILSPYPELASRLHLMPATLDLSAAEVELAGQIGREFRLRQALQPLLGFYDYVLIDTPPSLGLFTQNALIAASSVIIPVEPSFYALRAIGQLQKMIKLVLPYNKQLHVLGVLLTRFNGQTNLARTYQEELGTFLGPLLFRAVIPLNVKAAEAAAEGVPISRYAPNAKAATAYAELAEEVRRRVEGT